jgi:WD40 repeat protein
MGPLPHLTRRNFFSTVGIAVTTPFLTSCAGAAPTATIRTGARLETIRELSFELPPNHFVLSPDGDRLAVSTGMGHEAVVFELPSGTRLFSIFRYGYQSPTSLTFASQGRYLLSMPRVSSTFGGDNFAPSLFDGRTGTFVADIRLPAEIRSRLRMLLGFHDANGGEPFLAGLTAEQFRAVLRWVPETSSFRPAFEIGGGRLLDAGPGNRGLLRTSPGQRESAMEILALEDGRPIAAPPINREFVAATAWSRDGRRLATWHTGRAVAGVPAFSGSGQPIWIWDVERATPIGGFGADSGADDLATRRLAFSPDGRYLVGTSALAGFNFTHYYRTSLAVWRVADGALLFRRTSRDGDALIGPATFAGDGRNLVWIEGDKVLVAAMRGEW